MSLNGPRLAAVMAGRDISDAKLAELTGYKPESIRRFLEQPVAAPEAFALVAEAVLKLPPGRLRK